MLPCFLYRYHESSVTVAMKNTQYVWTLQYKCISDNRSQTLLFSSRY